MKTAIALSLLIVMLAVPAAATLSPKAAVQLVVFDRTDSVLGKQLHFDTSCGGGISPIMDEAVFTVDDGGHLVHFQERDLNPAVPGQPAGYQARGCGEARYTAKVPAGTDHIHVRFEASRSVQYAPASVNGLPQDYGFAEELQTRVGNAVVVTSLFNHTSGSADLSSFTPAPIYPAGTTNLTIVWHFEDESWGKGVLRQTGPNGAAYAADLKNITVEYSGVPISSPEVTQHHGRSGNLLVDDVQVAVAIPAQNINGSSDVRFRLDPSLAFSSVQTPDGKILETRGTRLHEGPQGFDRSIPLLERSNTYVQVTLASDFLAQHGPGTYRLTANTVSSIHVVSGLIPLAFFLLLVPVPFAVLAFLRARTFERAAFGSFSRSARYLRIALVIAFAYYVLVVTSAVAGGRLDLMAAFPLSPEAALMYVQVVVAIAAFLTLFLVARELYQITQPKEEPHA